MSTSTEVLSTEDTFSRNLVLSLSLHGILILSFSLKAVFFPSEAIMIQNAIRVDMVDLPDKLDEQPNLPAPVEDAPKPPAPEKVKEPPRKEPTKKADTKQAINLQKKALAKLSQQEAFAKIEQDLQRQKKMKDIEARKTALFKGNVATEGNSLTGLAKVQFDRYFNSLKQHINTYWDLPQWLANANLKAQALVVIDSNGRVVKRQIVRSSNNPVFDEKVLEAIDKSSPFPAPPERLKSVVGTSGMIFNFPEL